MCDLTDNVGIHWEIGNGRSIKVSEADVIVLCISFFFQAEDGIRDAQESRGLGDVYKRQDGRAGQPALADDTGSGAGGDVDGCGHARTSFLALSLIHI